MLEIIKIPVLLHTVISHFKPMGARIHFGYLWGGAFPYCGVVCKAAVKNWKEKKGDTNLAKLQKAIFYLRPLFAQRANIIPFLE